MQISDIDIRNNIFRRGPNLLWLLGHHDAGAPPLTTKIMQRIRLYNNLAYGMDARSAEHGGRASPVGGSRNGRSGIVVTAAFGMEDLIIEKNTIFDFKGNGPTFLFFDSTNYGAHAGLEVRDNIFTADRAVVSSISGAGIAVEALNRQWTRYPEPAWIFQNNVMCCALRGPQETRLPPDNAALDQVQDIGFTDPAAGGFDLKPDSRFKKSGSLGEDPGVNFKELEAALGQPLSSALKETAGTKKPKASGLEGVRARRSADQAR
jgi:hypothetical protein